MGKPKIIPTCEFKGSLYCSEENMHCYSRNPEDCKHYLDCYKRLSDDHKSDKVSFLDKALGRHKKRRESVHIERIESRSEEF